MPELAGRIADAFEADEHVAHSRSSNQGEMRRKTHRPAKSVASDAARPEAMRAEMPASTL